MVPDSLLRVLHLCVRLSPDYAVLHHVLTRVGLEQPEFPLHKDLLDLQHTHSLFLGDGWDHAYSDYADFGVWCVTGTGGT